MTTSKCPLKLSNSSGRGTVWTPTRSAAWTTSDSDSRKLGVGAVVGDEIWDQQSRVRVRLGPLTLAQYQDFLPDGTAYEPLKRLTKFFSNDELILKSSSS